MGLIEKIAKDVADMKEMLAQLAAAVADGSGAPTTVTLEPTAETQAEDPPTAEEDDFGDQTTQMTDDDLDFANETSTAKVAPATETKATTTSKATGTKATGAKTKVPETKAKAPPAGAKKVSMDDVRKAIRQYAVLEGEDSAKALLKKYGANKISEVKETDYAAVIAATAT